MFWSPHRLMCAIAIVATSHYGKKQKDSEQNKQLSCDFSVHYVTTYLANVFLFPNLPVYCFSHKSDIISSEPGFFFSFPNVVPQKGE